MSELPATESLDPATAGIDQLDDVALARALVEAHRVAVDAALAASEDIARATTLVVEAIEGGGRVVLVGAGTSGRLAVLDASELPPTFGVDPALVEGRIAGGDGALRRAVEGAEDDAEAGALVVQDVGEKDVVDRHFCERWGAVRAGGAGCGAGAWCADCGHRQFGRRCACA